MTRALRLLASALRDAGEPCVREERAGVPARVARPSSGAGPVVVYANAATPRGIEQPAVARLLGGLARAGFVAVAPELPSVRDGVVTPATVDALVAAARASGPRVALLGASTGAALSILACRRARGTGDSRRGGRALREPGSDAPARHDGHVRRAGPLRRRAARGGDVGAVAARVGSRRPGG